MINSDHIQPKLIDYTLGLLNAEERKLVDQHTAVCPSCHKALQAEIQLEQQVRTTLQTASAIDNRRVMALMPPLPSSSPRFSRWGITWRRQLASLAIMLLIIFGGMSVYQNNMQPTPGFVAPTSLAATATNTADPTETAVATQVSHQTTVSIQAEIAPQPAATPIASIKQRN